MKLSKASKKKVESWLSLHAKAYLNRTSILPNNLSLNMYSYGYGVHVSTETIILIHEVTGLPYTVVDRDCSNYPKKLEIMYNSKVPFFAVLTTEEYEEVING